MIPLYIAFAAASLAFLTRVLYGPFHLGLAVNSPLNAESLVAAAFVLAMVFRAGRSAKESSQRVPPLVFVGLAAVGLAAVALAFLPGVTSPLLHDSYVNVTRYPAQKWSGLIRTVLVHPMPREIFFRPLGFISYWIDGFWARVNPVLWHVWNLALHLINCALVWYLARRLALSPVSATVAALLFALHGTRPEVVAWAAARFDLLATLFALLALIAVERGASPGMIALATALALLSKESAFTLPLLMLLLVSFKPASERRRILIAAGTAALVCCVFLLYRTWFLGGVGGYTTAAGTPSVFQFSPVRSLKALFFREWAILFFPINWSSKPGPVLQAGSVVMILAAAGFLRFCHASRQALLASLAFVIIAVLPAQHLLLIGADLNGARVLYLPSVGLALFWGFAVEGCSLRLARIALPAGLLLFQTVALEHNLQIWRSVALRSRQICSDFASEIDRDNRPVAVRDLPVKLNGVFFLNNGFAECVAMNSSQPASRIHVQDTPADSRIFAWSDQDQTLREMH